MTFKKTKAGLPPGTLRIPIWALLLSLAVTLLVVAVTHESQRNAFESLFYIEANHFSTRFSRQLQESIDRFCNFSHFFSQSLEKDDFSDSSYFHYMTHHAMSVAPGLQQISWHPIPSHNEEQSEALFSIASEGGAKVLHHRFPPLELIEQLLNREPDQIPLLRLRFHDNENGMSSLLQFDLYFPIYSDSSQSRLMGVLIGTVDAESLAKSASSYPLSDSGEKFLIELFTAESSPQSIWRSTSYEPSTLSRLTSPLFNIDSLSFSKPLHFLDHSFKLQLTPVDYRLFVHQSPLLLWVLLGAGVAGSIALFFLLLFYGRYSTQRASQHLSAYSVASASRDFSLDREEDHSPSSEGLVAIDHRGMISFVDQNIAHLLGYPTDELIGQQINRFLTIQGRREAQKALINYRRGLIEENLKLEVYRKDGTWIVFGITLSPFFDDDGHYDGALVTLFDQTHRYRSKSNLLINEAHFRAITEHGGDLILICDLANALSYVSPSIEETLGYTVDSILGSSLLELVHHEDRSQIETELKEVLLTPTRRTHLTDFRIRNKKEQSIFFSGYATGLFNGERLDGVVISAQNINEKKIQELIIQQHNRTLELMGEEVPLDQAIREFLLCVERFLPEAKSAIHLIDPHIRQITTTISPRLDAALIEAHEGLAIATGISPASQAAYHKSRFISDDLSLELFSPSINAVMAALALRATWADPLFSTKGELIGVFSLYFPTPLKPDTLQSQLMDSISRLVAIAIERHLTEEALRDSEIKWRALITHLPDNVALLALDGTILYANRVAQAYNLDDVLGTRLVDYVAPKHRAPFQETLDRALATGKTQTYETPLNTPKGVVWWSNRVGLMRRSGKITGFITIGSDVTERKKYELSLQILSSAVEQSGSAIIITNIKGNIEYVNPRFTEITGYGINEVKGKKSSIWRSVETPPSTHRELWKTITSGKTWYGEILNQRKNGELFWTLESISPVTNKEGAITHFIAICEDLTRIKETQREMERLTYYDGLTGLQNRRLFRENLEEALAGLENRSEAMALIFLDLDQFKRINDTLGHDAGDQLLKNIAHLLRSIVKADDLVARLGGDEFALLLKHVQGANEASLVARRIIEILNHPISLLNQEMTVTASIGITLTPDDSTDPNVLMRNADLAMYRAKESGRNTYKFYTEEMNDEVMGRLALENDLRKALEQEQFVLFFQPILNFNTSQLHGVEVLVRWLHPEKGIVPPEEFIPMLEESGMVIPLGKWILEEACRSARIIEAQHPNHLVFSVNLSARQFTDPNLVTIVEDALSHSGLSPQLLDLEITETMLMENLDDGVSILDHLKSLGVSLTIDDFGTGYSSLGYLKKLPINKVKVDKTFVSEIPHNINDMEITAAVIAMAHKLNLQVTAEGIETDEQHAFLRENKCDYGQGYLYSKPLDWDTFISQLTAPSPPISSENEGGSEDECENGD